MTGKRFNIHSDEDNERIWISDVQEHKEIEIQHYYGIATVVKMLNELHEENMLLKKYRNAIWHCDSSKIIRVNENTGEVDLIDKESKKG